MVGGTTKAGPARCPARARRTRRRPRSAAPRARPAAAPCRRGAGAPLTPSLATSSTNVPSSRPIRTLTRVGLGVLVRVAHRLGEHRLGQRLERWRDVALVARVERHAEVRVHAREPLDLGHERRLGRARRAAERALERGAQIAQRRLRLGRAALRAPRRADRPRRRAPSRRRTAAGSRPRGSRARGRSAARAGGLLGLLGDDPRHRGERRRLAERPQQIPLGVVERRLVEQRGRRRSRRSRGPPPPSARTPAGPARGTRSRTPPGPARSCRPRSRSPGPRAATGPRSAPTPRSRGRRRTVRG